MKQTAVEWLQNQLTEVEFNLINKNFLWQYKTNSIASHILKEIFEKAKEMEKEQIVEAWNIRAKIDGVLTYTDNRTAEQYYNETYESK